MSIIRVSDLHKSFGKQKILHGLDIEIQAGTINAIMGPNGSGKSTLLKSVLGLVIPDKGEIIVECKNAVNSWVYRKHIGYMPQIANYPENISVLELIRMIKDIRKEEANENELLEIFNLKGALNKKLKELSGGMRQKVNAVIAFMFDSSILIFDEPTVGLDPLSRITFKNLIRSAKNKGKTIILSTHYLNEIEELADNIIFILDGKVYFQGSVEEMKAHEHESNLENAAARILENAVNYQ
jgi:Cu-processing system ATP-binding protein